MIQGTWNEVGKGPDSKWEGWHIPDHDGIPGPFYDLREMVRTGDVSEQAAIRDLVAIAAGFSQPYQHIVRTYVKTHSDTKDDEASNELWRG